MRFCHVVLFVHSFFFSSTVWAISCLLDLCLTETKVCFSLFILSFGSNVTNKHCMGFTKFISSYNGKYHWQFNCKNWPRCQQLSWLRGVIWVYPRSCQSCHWAPFSFWSFAFTFQAIGVQWRDPLGTRSTGCSDKKNTPNINVLWFLFISFYFFSFFLFISIEQSFWNPLAETAVWFISRFTFSFMFTLHSVGTSTSSISIWLSDRPSTLIIWPQDFLGFLGNGHEPKSGAVFDAALHKNGFLCETLTNLYS